MVKIRESNAKVTASEGQGIYEVTLITEGQGSSGYYSKELLEEYGALTFNENRPMFANHPTDEEFENGRDITKLMARTIEAARVVEEDGVAKLKSKIKVRSEWREFVEEYKDTIGLSIFATGEAHEGEIDGNKTMIVESFDYSDPYRSIDFVVAAGRGGKVDRMIESAQKVIEMTANDKREALQAAVNDNDSTGYSWVRDFDDTYVYVDSSGDLFQIEYTSNESGKIVLGDRTEVRVKTEYVPVSENDRGNVPANPEVKEYTMAFEDEVKDGISALAEQVGALVESLKPVEDAPKDEIDRAAVVESALEAGLSKSARDRVLKAVEAGETPDTAIAAEKALHDEIVKEYQAKAENGTTGYVRESAPGDKATSDLSGLKF